MARKPKPSGRNRKDRSLSEIARKPPFRQSRPRILIVCEGQKTEPIYFNTLKKVFRLTSVTVLIDHAAGKTSSKQIVVRAIDRKMEDSDFDEVWCVFDKEITGQIQVFDQARALAETNDIKLAVSNPAFEFWFLLHYEFTSRPFSSANELITALKQHIPTYEKNYNNCSSLIGMLDTAIDHAQRVLVNHPDEEFAPNPSTYVHLLAHKLKNFAEN